MAGNCSEWITEYSPQYNVERNYASCCVLRGDYYSTDVSFYTSYRRHTDATILHTLLDQSFFIDGEKQV